METRITTTVGGLVANRGKRELHILAKSAQQLANARALLATHSFNRLFNMARPTPGVRNVAYLVASND